MKWDYLFEAFVALPSILLDTVVEGLHKIVTEERAIAVYGEFDEEEIDAELSMIRGEGRSAQDAALQELNEQL